MSVCVCVSCAWRSLRCAASVEVTPGESALKLSRAVSVALLLTYLAYLYFQLRTHIHLYEEKPDTVDSAAVVAADNNAEAGSESGTSPAKSEAEEGEEESPDLSFWGAIGAYCSSCCVLTAGRDGRELCRQERSPMSLLCYRDRRLASGHHRVHLCLVRDSCVGA